MGNLGRAGDPRSFEPRNRSADDRAPLTIGGKGEAQLDAELAARTAAARAPGPSAGQPDSPAAQAFKQIQAVGAACEEHRQYVEAQAFDQKSGRWRMAPEDRRAIVEGFATPQVRRQLDDAVRPVIDARDQAQAKLDRLRAELVTPDDPTAQLKAQRIWDRQRQYLDGSANGSERVARAREIIRDATDPAEFVVLVEEVQTDLRIMASRSTGWSRSMRGTFRRWRRPARKSRATTSRSSRHNSTLTRNGRRSAPGIGLSRWSTRTSRGFPSCQLVDLAAREGWREGFVIFATRVGEYARDLRDRDHRGHAGASDHRDHAGDRGDHGTVPPGRRHRSKRPVQARIS